MEAKEESNLEIRETFSSLQEEVEIKTKKLKKVRTIQDANISPDSLNNGC